MSDYERVKALFPKPTPCGVWLDLQNAFQGYVTPRGAYCLRRPVILSGGLRRYEMFRLTPKGGMQFEGYAQP